MTKSCHVLASFALLACLGVVAAPDGATISNSGSTNTAGWQIEVYSDGTATLTAGQRQNASAPTPFKVDPALAQRFLAEAKALQDAGPTALRSCMKSASFGSATRVTYHGFVSPDLQCPATTPAASALAADMKQIEQASGVSTMPRRIRLMPGEMRSAPQTAPSPTTSP